MSHGLKALSVGILNPARLEKIYIIARILQHIVLKKNTGLTEAAVVFFIGC